MRMQTMNTQISDTQNATPEKDIANRILYEPWEEWISTLIGIGADPLEETAGIAHFAKVTGCAIHSSLAMMFRGGRAGVVKGMELHARIDARA